jgi:hypothetical protein
MYDAKLHFGELVFKVRKGRRGAAQDVVTRSQAAV